MKKANKPGVSTLHKKEGGSLKKKPSKPGTKLSEVGDQKLVRNHGTHQFELGLHHEGPGQAEVAAPKYAELYDFAPSGYFTLSQKGKIIELNLCGSQMLGKERSDLKNKLFVSFLSDDAKPGFSQFLEKIFTGKAKESHKFTLSKNGNSQMYVHLTGIAIKNGEQCLISAFEITGRTRAEEEQPGSSEDRFRSLSENAKVGLYRMTPDGSILLANRALVAMLGYSSFDELAQRNLEKDGFGPAHQRKAFLEKIEQNGEVNNCESTWIRQDRTPVHVRESALAIRDTNGMILYYDGTVEDITEHKFAEDLLRINVERLQELNVLQYRLQYPSPIGEKLKLITDTVVRIMGADFARIWMIKPGDRCHDGCIHAPVTEGEHICRFRDRCLHLMSSSGSYTHTNGQVHARVPFGCYKIGKIAAAEEPKFLTNSVTTDPRVHNNAWAKELGLVSFAGYRLGDTAGKPLGVLALFSKKVITPEEDSFLELIAHSTSWVLHSERDEAVLRESEERYLNLVESIPDWIWEVDAQGNYTYASPAVRNILGYAPEDIIGRSPFDLMPEEERQRIGGMYAGIIAKRQPIVAMENVNRHRDGRLIVLETSGIPIFGHNGELHGYRGIDRDITERKRAVEKLQESEEKLSTLFASMTEMVTTHKLVFNENGEVVNYQITDCNDAFTAITGIKKEDAIGKLVTEVYKTDTPPHLEEYAQVAVTGKPYKFTEYSHYIDKHLIVSVISPKKNQFSTIATDITVIQQIQEEIKAKNKELENYLYVASHDLRSPLVNIQGFSQRFLKQSDAIKNVLNKCQLETEEKQGLEKITKEDIPKTLNFILSNVIKMENLINGLLQISRTGRVVMAIQKVDMNRLIKTIIAGHNFQITELSARVVIENLSDCHGDENLLNQLFSNIISNALKYRDGSRQLVIEIASQVQSNKLIYSVKDSGIGIEPRHLEKIWDVFYRIDPGSNVTGDGIGLSLSRRITEKHKGKIWAESEIGKGSVFYIELQRNEFSE